MEVLMIVGRKHIDFTDENGRRVCGWSIFFTRQDDQAEGVVTGKMFLSDARADSIMIPEPGRSYEVYYDRFGRVQKFVAVK